LSFRGGEVAVSALGGVIGTRTVTIPAGAIWINGLGSTTSTLSSKVWA
jgi:hypothetical protein